MFALADQPLILLVEDDLDTADMLRRFFRRKGLPCEVVHDGQSALQFFKSHRPTYLVLDEAMPGMTGLDLLRRLRAWPEYQDIPAVFYSAAYDWRKQMESEALGAKAWLVKGVSRLDDLAEQVRILCNPPEGQA